MKVDNVSNLYHFPKRVAAEHSHGQSSVAKAFQTQTPTSTESDVSAEATESGTSERADGENLPGVVGPAPDPQAPQGLEGTSRALERLQHNLDKKPGNSGLEHALEMVQRNQQRHSIETQA